MLTDTTTDRIIAVDYSQSLEAMIAAGKYDWVNDNITAKKFPIEGTGTKKFRAKLFGFNRAISSDDAVAAMKADNFTPGDHVHGSAYGAAFPKDRLEHPIACLGSSAQVYRYRSVVCLYRDDAERHLYLYGWGGDWYDGWRFLGVQEVSET